MKKMIFFFRKNQKEKKMKKQKTRPKHIKGSQEHYEDKTHFCVCPNK